MTPDERHRMNRLELALREVAQHAEDVFDVDPGDPDLPGDHYERHARQMVNVALQTLLVYGHDRGDQG